MEKGRGNSRIARFMWPKCSSETLDQARSSCFLLKSTTWICMNFIYSHMVTNFQQNLVCVVQTWAFLQSDFAELFLRFMRFSRLLSLSFLVFWVPDRWVQITVDTFDGSDHTSNCRRTVFSDRRLANSLFSRITMSFLMESRWAMICCTAIS